MSSLDTYFPDYRSLFPLSGTKNWDLSNNSKINIEDVKHHTHSPTQTHSSMHARDGVKKTKKTLALVCRRKKQIYGKFAHL